MKQDQFMYDVCKCTLYNAQAHVSIGGKIAKCQRIWIEFWKYQWKFSAHWIEQLMEILLIERTNSIALACALGCHRHLIHQKLSALNYWPLLCSRMCEDLNICLLKYASFAFSQYNRPFDLFRLHREQKRKTHMQKIQKTDGSYSFIALKFTNISNHFN